MRLARTMSFEEPPHWLAIVSQCRLKLNVFVQCSFEDPPQPLKTDSTSKLISIEMFKVVPTKPNSIFVVSYSTNSTFITVKYKRPLVEK